MSEQFCCPKCGITITKNDTEKPKMRLNSRGRLKAKGIVPSPEDTNHKRDDNRGSNRLIQPKTNLRA